MKKFLSITTAVMILLCSAVFSGCTDNNNNTAPTTAATEAAKPDKYSSSELKAYLDSFTKGKSPVYGTWKIEGINAVSYIFRNDGYAQMVMGTEADFTKLELDEKNKTLGAAFILGINGTYSYTLSSDNKTLTLTSDDSKYVLKKQKDYNLLPKPKKNPKLDKELFGWWKSSGKQIYFFGSDGIMYSNTISMETCYTYNAEKCKIRAIYDYAGDVKIDLAYSVKNDKLTLEGNKFKRFEP